MKEYLAKLLKALSEKNQAMQTALSKSAGEGSTPDEATEAEIQAIEKDIAAIEVNIGGVDVSYSDQATLEDADGTITNLWQENKFAVRVEKFITWAKRRPIAAAWIDYSTP